MSKVKALFHVVFCTKRREMTIPEAHCRDLYNVIWTEVKKHNSRALRIGGIQNHIHMLIDLNPTVPLSELMRAVKGQTSYWMRRDPRFATFGGWAHEYYACSVSPEHEARVVNYIAGQVEHHLGRPQAEPQAEARGLLEPASAMREEDEG